MSPTSCVTCINLNSPEVVKEDALPISTVEGEDDRGAGVGVGGNPGAVEHKEEEHEGGHHDDNLAHADSQKVVVVSRRGVTVGAVG